MSGCFYRVLRGTVHGGLLCVIADVHSDYLGSGALGQQKAPLLKGDDAGVVYAGFYVRH